MKNIIKINNNKYKLRTELVVINFMISIISIILVAFVFQRVYTGVIEKRIDELLETYFTQTQNQIEYYFSNIDVTSKNVFYNKEIQGIIKKDDENFQKHNLIRDHLFHYLQFDDSIRGIHIIDNDFKIYSTTRYVLSLQIRKFFRNLDEDKYNDGKLYFAGPFQSDITGTDELIAFRFIRVIRSTHYSNFFDEIGIGIFVLDLDKINSIIGISNLAEKSVVYITDKNKKMIISTKESIARKHMEKTGELLNTKENNININEQNYLVKTSKIKNLNWQITALINIEKTKKDINKIKYYLLMILLVMVIVVLCISFIFNLKLTAPIKKIIDACDRVATGDFKVKLNFSYKNEITKIGNSFNHMVEKIDNLTNKLLKSQKKIHQVQLEKKQLVLDGLQSQINAHFLYNTLHTIRGMAYSNAREEISALISNLVGHLRYITKIDEYVTLEEELNHLKKYVEIERIGYFNNFEVKFEIAEEIKKAKILKLTLQPIVENAIMHGIDENLGNSIIKITARRRNNKIVVKVLDNGQGISADELDKINIKLNSEDSTKDITEDSTNDNGKIGIFNIHRRIQLYYGKNYGIKVKSWPNKGTCVILTYRNIDKE